MSAGDSDLPQFTVSARGKHAWQPVMPYLEAHFGGLPSGRIESVFGFVEPCTLYGGRPYWFRQISDADTRELNSRGIGVRIPLTTHRVTRAGYEYNRRLLDKYHRRPNALIVHDDALVPWLRADYPQYRIEASMLKFLNTHDKIERALGVYDTVVVPMDMVENRAFLQTMPHKDRVTLFGNAGCALTCPARICYARISRANRLLGSRNPFVRWCLGFPFGIWHVRCSQSTIERRTRGIVDFELAPLIAMGFRRFKMLRARPGRQTAF